jgi:hypothetical protein
LLFLILFANLSAAPGWVARWENTRRQTRTIQCFIILSTTETDLPWATLYVSS